MSKFDKIITMSKTIKIVHEYDDGFDIDVWQVRTPLSNDKLTLSLNQAFVKTEKDQAEFEDGDTMLSHMLKDKQITHYTYLNGGSQLADYDAIDGNFDVEWSQDDGIEYKNSLKQNKTKTRGGR